MCPGGGCKPTSTTASSVPRRCPPTPAGHSGIRCEPSITAPAAGEPAAKRHPHPGHGQLDNTRFYYRVECARTVTEIAWAEFYALLSNGTNYIGRRTFS